MNTITIRENKTVLECCILMKTSRQNAIAVVDNNFQLIGILSEKDIVRSVVNNYDYSKILVNELMTINPKKIISKTIELGNDKIKFKQQKQENETALEIMAKNNFRHVPIVDEDSRFIRMVNIVEAAENLFQGKNKKNFFKRLNNSAKKIMKFHSKQNNSNNKRGFSSRNTNINLSSLSTSQTIFDCCKFLSSNRKSATLCQSEYGSCGIISESDIVRRVIAERKDPNKTILADVMTPNPSKISIDVEPINALKQMIKLKYRHLAVVQPKTNEYIMIMDILSVVRASLIEKGVSVVSISVGGSSKESLPTTLPAVAEVELEKSEIALEDDIEEEITIENVEEEKIVMKNDANLPVIEEIQFTAPVVEEVKEEKEPESKLNKHEYQAVMKLKESNFDGAIKQLTIALNQVKDNKRDTARIHSRRAACYNVLNDLDKAIDDYELSLKLSNADNFEDLILEASIGLSEVLIEKEQYEKVSEVLIKLNNLEKSLPVYEQLLLELKRIKELGNGFYKENDANAGRLCFTNAIRIFTILNTITKFKESKEFLRLGAVCYSNRAACYIKTKEFSFGIKDCKEALIIDPTYERNYSRLTLIYSQTPKHQEAYEKFVSDSLVLFPNNKELIQHSKELQENQEDQENSPSLSNNKDVEAIKNLGLLFAGTAS